jgi:Ca2+-binding EF-hand superfamily protein
MNRMLTGLTLGTLVAATLATAALAERGGGGPMGLGHDGPFGAFDFAAIDSDGDGKITRDELAAHRAARLAAMDTDKDGKLSEAELRAHVMERAGERAEAMAARMIERLDSDGDGLVSAEEMAAGPARLDIFDRIDRDGDGAISEAEAEAARKHMARRMGHHHGRGHGGVND